MRSRTPPDEVFSWLKDAGFGQERYYKKLSVRTPLRVAFVRKILQRYKDVKVFRGYISTSDFLCVCACTLLGKCMP